MPLPRLLEELLRAPGPPGREDAVQTIARREALAAGAEVEADALGSTVARVPGAAGGRLLALFAHADGIGLSVRDAEEGGLVVVAPLGRWKPAAALGQRVEVLARDARVPAVATRRGEGEASALGGRGGAALGRGGRGAADGGLRPRARRRRVLRAVGAGPGIHRGRFRARPDEAGRGTRDR